MLFGFVLILIILNSCTSHSPAWEDLESADIIMEEMPDSALKILYHISPVHLKGEEENARYALLMTQALTKNYYIITNDSLINIALHYYSKRKPSHYFMRTLFYASEIDYCNYQYENCMKKLMVAFELAQKYNDYYWMAKIEESKADAYARLYNWEDCSIHALNGANLYKVALKERNHRFSMVEYANAINCLGNETRACCILDSIYQIAYEEGDKGLMCYCLDAQFKISFKNNKYKEAVEYIREYEILSDNEELSATTYAYLGQAFLQLNLPEKALIMIEKADSLSHTNIEEITVELAKANYNKYFDYFRDALCYLEEVLILQNKKIEETFRASTFSVERDFYNQKVKTEETKNYNQKISFFLILMIIIIALIFIWIFYQMRIKIKEAELDSKISDIISQSSSLMEMESLNSKLKEDVLAYQNKIETLNNKINSMPFNNENEIQYNNDCALKHLRCEMEILFKESWSLLNMLCYEYFEKGNDEKMRNKILGSIENEIKKINSNSNILTLEKSINKYRGDVISLISVC